MMSSRAPSESRAPPRQQGPRRREGSGGAPSPSPHPGCPAGVVAPLMRCNCSAAPTLLRGRDGAEWARGVHRAWCAECSGTPWRGCSSQFTKVSPTRSLTTIRVAVKASVSGWSVSCASASRGGTGRCCRILRWGCCCSQEKTAARGKGFNASRTRCCQPGPRLRAARAARGSSPAGNWVLRRS